MAAPEIDNSKDEQKGVRHSDAEWYHATNLDEDAQKISEEGLRYDSFDEEYGRMLHNGGLLGLGIYVTHEWKTALWYGGHLFSLSLLPGTRIVDSTRAYDDKIIEYLTREFGKSILKGDNCEKAIPHNKKLTREELLQLHLYHYHQTWGKEWGQSQDGWPRKRRRHDKALQSTVRMLKRHGYHGYGDAEGEMGIVIFAPDRVRVERKVLEMPSYDSWKFSDGRTPPYTLEELEAKYPVRLDPRRSS